MELSAKYCFYVSKREQWLMSEKEGSFFKRKRLIMLGNAVEVISENGKTGDYITLAPIQMGLVFRMR